MKNNDKIRVSQEFKEIINYLKAKNLLMGKKDISIPEITKIMATNIDKEKIWQNGFANR